MESQVQQGKQWLEELLKLIGLPTSVSTEGFEKIATDSDSVWLNIDTEQLTAEEKQQLIGERGENIDAMQYLANTLINLSLDSESQSSFTIELDGYRFERHRELVAIAEETAARVRETGEPVAIPGLSAAERKQIHSWLHDADDLTTESRGQEPDRRLIVQLNRS